MLSKKTNIRTLSLLMRHVELLLCRQDIREGDRIPLGVL